jgi:hypothetical protein
MNTGIADACDLGWKLAAVLRGLAGPALLASYDAERRPVGIRNREASRHHSGTRAKIATVYRELMPPGADSESARREAARRIAALGNAENESYGIEYGYAYRDSPAICTDPDADIPSDPLRYQPSTAPGVRLPSVLLAGDTPIYDRLGAWFTLLCSGAPPSSEMIEAAATRGLPLDVLSVEEPELVSVYGRGLLLVRPDQHIAWRGAACEDRRAADAILSRVLGFETT